jgi:LPXTG-site transpeptidase (sortase) family protein
VGERRPAQVVSGLLVIVVPALLAGLAVVLLTAPDGPQVRAVSTAGPAHAAKLDPAPVRQARKHGRRPPPQLLRIPSARIAVRVIPVRARGGQLEVPPVQRVGWVRSGPRPGEPGRTVLIGHRDSPAGAAPFAGLASLEPGTRVETVARGSRHDYRVTSVQQVPKTEFPATRVYASTDGSTLALITCEGAFEEATGYLDNLIVYAREVARPKHRA